MSRKRVDRITCTECDGSGKQEDKRRNCLMCKGTGELEEEDCSMCEGNGSYTEDEIVYSCDYCGGTGKSGIYVSTK